MNDKRDEQQAAEGKVMKMYTDSAPDVANLFEWAYINHVAWSLAAILAALVLWLAVALVATENQRNALASQQCMDKVFKTEIDKSCLRKVKSREHWWQHLGFALTNLDGEK